MHPGPGPGFGGGQGIDGVGIVQSVVALLVLGSVVAFGVLVLRRLDAIERAVRGAPAHPPAPARIAPPMVAPPVAVVTDADQRAWQQQVPVAPQPHPQAQQRPQSQEGSAPA